MDDTPKALRAALLKARQSFEAVHKDGKSNRNRYATLGAVLEAVEGPLADNGLYITQSAVPMEHGWAMQTRVEHIDGGELVGIVPMLLDPPGSGINPMQAAGSAISYARRYGLMTLLSLVAEDDDAQTAFRPQQAAPRYEAPPARPQAPPQRQSAPPPNDDYDDHPAPSSQGDDRPPQTGRQLYAWVCKRQDAGADKLLFKLNNWAKREGIGGKMVDWTSGEVAAVHHYARELLGEIEPVEA